MADGAIKPVSVWKKRATWIQKVQCCFIQVSMLTSVDTFATQYIFELTSTLLFSLKSVLSEHAGHILQVPLK